MSQDDIRSVIVSARGKLLLAEQIISQLKKVGKEINEQTFYQNIKKVEKDDDIGTESKLITRFSVGKRTQFKAKLWYHKGNMGTPLVV